MSTMSDDDRDIDIESDEENDSDPRSSQRNPANPNYSQAEKRAHHNALERKRRDHIKDSFTSLREAVPSLQGEKPSRAQILKKSAEYIQFMRRKNQAHQQDVDDLKKQNNALEGQIRSLEKALDSFASDQMPDRVKSEPDTSDEDDTHMNGRRSKKLKAYH